MELALRTAVRQAGKGPLALFKREPALLGGCVAVAVFYAAYSFLNYSHFNSGTDLAIFDQAIWHYSRFEAPVSTFLSPWGYGNFLGDHFEPLLVIIAPLYWIWDNVGVLLIVQAVLLAASIVPIFIFCERRLGRVGAYLMAFAYASFWGIASALSFGFHEVAFFPLLLGLIVLAVEDRRWRALAALVFVLLLVKENMGVFLVFIGLYMGVAHKEWRKGALVAAAGAIWFVVVTDYVQPAFVGGNQYRHWMYGAIGKDLSSALENIVANPTRLPRVFFSGTFDPGREWAAWSKVGTLAVLFAPFFGLALLSPLGLLLIPLLLERMLASNPWLWTPYLHYSLTIAPVLVMASADALARLARWRPLMPRARLVIVGGAAAILVANLAVATRFPLRDMAKPSFYRSSPADRAREAAIARVPPNASVVTGASMMSHLTHRNRVYVMRAKVPRTDYIVTDPAEYFWARWPDAGYADRQRLFLDKGASYEPVFYQDKVVVMQRRAMFASGPTR